LLGLAVGVPVSAWAQSFSVLFERALASEPAYLAATSSRDAARARTGQALGAMLPQLSLSANTHINDREYATRGSAQPPAGDRYNSNSAQLSLNQPLWRQANIAGLRQAEAAAAQADQQLAGAEMELLSRMATAWFDLLAARDGVLHAAQQVAATRRQWEMVSRGVELGNASPPQAEEAKAKYDQALAESVAAETDSRIKRAALEQLAGPLDETTLPVLRDDAAPEGAGMAALETWLESVETGNPPLRAAREAFEVAGHEVDKQRAGHLPTLDLVATYGKNSQATGGFPGQAGYDIKQNAIGLQLNVPIFSGGTQMAKVDEAVAMKEKARQDMEAARRAARFAAQQAWLGWQGATARAQAGNQGMRAAQAALQVARRGLETGLKTDLDVLLAEQQLAAARRDQRKARYEQIISRLKLKAAAGSAMLKDVMAVDSLFVAIETSPDSVPQRPPRFEPLLLRPEKEVEI
jgi:outer membrane protein